MPRVRRHLRRKTGLQELSCISYGGEWISKFMGKRRQEFILAPIRIAQLFLECAPLRQVAHDHHPAAGHGGRIPDGSIGGVDPPIRLEPSALLSFVFDRISAQNAQEVRLEALEGCPTENVLDRAA